MLLMTLVMANSSSARGNTLAGSRPNIILVMTDDRGMGDEIVQTPNIDTFYQHSIRFSDFQVNPTCSSTRAVMMSGGASLKNGVMHTVFQIGSLQIFKDGRERGEKHQ